MALPQAVEVGFLLWIFWTGLQGGRLFLKLIFVQSIQTASVRYFFSLMFALIVSLYAVVLLDAASSEFINRELSRLLLDATMTVLLVSTVLVGPCWTFWRVLNDLWGSREYRTKSSTLPPVRTVILGLITCVLLVMLYVGSWRALPDLAVVFPADVSLFHVALATVLAKVACFGVVGMGIMGGYAACATPWGFLRPYLARNSAEDARLLLGALTKRQRTLLQLWSLRRHKIAQLRVQELSTRGSNQGGASLASQPQKSDKGIMSWLSRAITGGGGVSIEQLETECDGIQRVSLDIFLQAQEAQNIIEMSERRSDIGGKVGAAFGVVLSCFAIAKVIHIAIVVLMLLLGIDDGSGDGMRLNGAAKLLSLLSPADGGSNNSNDEGSAIRLTRAAVIFNALMITMSLRGFLLTIFRLTSAYGASIGPESMALVFTTSMSAYFAAQVLMLRTQLPPDNPSVLVQSFGMIPLKVYQRTNDLCFLAACVGSFLVTRFLLRE